MNGAPSACGREGPVLIVTDLCTMRPDPETMEFEVVTLHPGVTARAGEREYRVAGSIRAARGDDRGAFRR